MAGQNYLLPCHPSCMVEDRFSVCEEYADQAEIPQWALIGTLLQRPIHSVASLEDLLSSIQYDLQFSTLRSTLCERESNFFTSVWPRMVTCGLRLPQLFPDGVLETLHQQVTSSVSLSREQIASLLVHMFLCSLRPPIWSKFWANFSVWYNSESTPVKAYLCCLLDYFSLLDSTGKPINPLETVEFCRRVLIQPPSWSTSISQFGPGILICSTNLEPEPACYAEVSFANKDVGFGMSGTQEEVKMAMSPEACVAMVITPTLLDNETLIIRGAQQIGYCKGTGRSVTYNGPLDNAKKRDWKKRWIISMDALELDTMECCEDNTGSALGSTLIHELRESVLQRELNKAYCGFSGIESASEVDSTVSIATGHWGCGSFGGNKYAKALVQLMAAAEAKKLLIYHDVENSAKGDNTETPFLKELKTFVDFLVDHKISVSKLYSAMVEVGQNASTNCDHSLFDIICNKLTMS